MSDTDKERECSRSEFVASLRRLADALDGGHTFEIQVSGERVYVPARARFSIEHEREEGEEELEFSLSWGTNPRG